MEKLKEHVFSLNNTAENLKEILCIVGGLPAFPEKLHVMEVISEASLKTKEVADLVEVSAMSKELSYCRLYLKKYLVDTDDPRKDVDDFIDSRADLAEKEFEDARRAGLTVDQAQERSIAVLMDGV